MRVAVKDHRRVFTAETEEAIRGIRAAFPPRRVMVFDRLREWGGALVKAGGRSYVVTDDGTIYPEGD